MTRDLYEIATPTPGEIHAVRLSELPDFASHRAAAEPESPEMPFGEWYCHAEECDVREVRIHFKLFGKPMPAELRCPCCGSALKFHHYLVPVPLRRVVT
jgi:hypothetical protein